MAELWDATPVYTRADLRRLRAHTGAARTPRLRFQAAGPAPPAPARSRSGRYLYRLTVPLALPPEPRRPRPLAERPEVG